MSGLFRLISKIKRWEEYHLIMRTWIQNRFVFMSVVILSMTQYCIDEKDKIKQ